MFIFEILFPIVLIIYLFPVSTLVATRFKLKLGGELYIVTYGYTFLPGLVAVLVHDQINEVIGRVGYLLVVGLGPYLLLASHVVWKTATKPKKELRRCGEVVD